MENISMQEAMALLIEAENMDRTARLKLQTERLRKLVSYVREHSDYFRELYGEIDLEQLNTASLPPTQKKELMEHYEQWVTDSEITYSGVMSYLKETKAEQLYLSKYSGLTTSGTSGVPMPMLRDSYHNTIHGAMINRRFISKNISPDIMNPCNSKIASIIYTDPKISSFRSFMKAKKAAGKYADNMQAFSPAMSIKELTRQVGEFNPDMITCYPSALCALALEQKKGNLHLNLKAIACSAEVLTEEMFALFTETFHCPVLNNYCSTEGGEAAMSCSCGHLHMNEDWVIIEPVDKDMQPIKDESEWSDGILITDLSNYVQPIIRYHMNDQIRIHTHCDCKSTFPYMEIRGRSGGVAEICGNTVMIISLVAELEKMPLVYATQVIQTTSDTLEIRAICIREEDREKAFSMIEQKVKVVLDREECRDYHIIWSEQEPYRSNRGGKMQSFVSLI